MPSVLIHSCGECTVTLVTRSRVLLCKAVFHIGELRRSSPFAPPIVRSVAPGNSNSFGRQYIFRSRRFHQDFSHQASPWPSIVPPPPMATLVTFSPHKKDIGICSLPWLQPLLMHPNFPVLSKHPASGI
jgi:hypothetical protein